jgi:hypothetical protein
MPGALAGLIFFGRYPATISPASQEDADVFFF